MKQTRLSFLQTVPGCDGPQDKSRVKKHQPSQMVPVGVRKVATPERHAISPDFDFSGNNFLNRALFR